LNGSGLLSQLQAYLAHGLRFTLYVFRSERARSMQIHVTKPCTYGFSCSRLHVWLHSVILSIFVIKLL